MKARNSIIKLLCIIFLEAVLYQCSNVLDLSKLTDEKWYNDEFSIHFMEDATFISYYTVDDKDGSISGEVRELEPYKYELSVLNREGSEIPFFQDKMLFSLVDKPQDPKSTVYLVDETGKIQLWNASYLVPRDEEILLNNEFACITLGNELSTTTNDLHIRKGPGTDYDYDIYHYIDSGGVLRTKDSVLNGTNLRLLARTKIRFQVSDWNHYWYFVEYKEPEDNLIVYKRAWMFGEFLNVPENSRRTITINLPKNDQSLYTTTVEIKGAVSGDPVSMSYEIKDVYGNSEESVPINNYDRDKHIFSLTLNQYEGDVNFGSNVIRFNANYSDGEEVFKQLTFYLHESEGERAKPVIYLYPEQETLVHLKVEPANGISISEPLYLDGWTVYAFPDGRLINKVDNSEYDYLFWESPDYNIYQYESGFVVKTTDLPVFFQDKLQFMGLNNTEIADFLEFWIPILNDGPYYLIHFHSRESQDTFAPLTVDPEPDTIIRVFFDSKPLNMPVSVEPQVLQPTIREGFTLVEWGGMRYKNTNETN